MFLKTMWLNVSLLAFMYFIIGFSSYAQHNNLGMQHVATNTAVGVLFNYENFAAGTFTNDGNLYIHNNWSNNGIVNFTNGMTTGMTSFIGAVQQNITGTGTTDFYNVSFNNAIMDPSFLLQKEINIYGNVDFTDGIIQDAGNGLLIFNNDAKHTNTTDTSFVDGKVRKIGNDAFTFPIGDDDGSGTFLHRLAAISAPGVATDAFDAQYFWKKSSNSLLSKENKVNEIDSNEYWIIEQTAGNSIPDVTLSWNTLTTPASLLTNPDMLIITRWNGTQWINEGGMVNTSNNTITTTPSDYGTFTLATNYPCNDIVNSSPLVTNDILRDTIYVQTADTISLNYSTAFTPSDSLGIISQSNASLGIPGILNDSMFVYTANCMQGVDSMVIYLFNRSTNVVCDTLIAIVNVLDTTSPITVCQDITLHLDASENAVLTAAEVDNGSTDNCSISSISINKTQFNCSNIGSNAVTLSLMDISGNVDTCISNVTVADTGNFCVPVTASMGLQDTIICRDDCIDFLDRSINATSWQWTFNGAIPATSSDQDPSNICFLDTGVYHIQLIASNYFSTDTTSINMYVKDLPVISAGENDTIKLTEITTLTALGPEGNYVWSPIDGLACPTCMTTLATPEESTFYTVTVTDTNSCMMSDTVLVVVNYDQVVFVPNIFSPNNDGKHDILYVMGKGIKSFSFSIYNRWGEEVFQTNDTTIGWDGKVNGKPMNKAVFVYSLNATMEDNTTIKQKGNITLLR